jgi:hypothetical protein
MNLNEICFWNYPFKHYTFSNFFNQQELVEYKSIDPHGSSGNILEKTRTSSKNRVFLNNDLCQTYELYSRIKDFFINKDTINLFESYRNDRKIPEYLRIEVIKDVGESWLEPHCDIQEKYLSFLLFINDVNENENLGTDLYSADHVVRKTVPFVDNTGYFFYPSHDTWHGLERKKINIHRKILMVNYVTFPTEIKIR